MKLKLDENIPASAKRRLTEIGYDTDTVVDEKLGGRPDQEVWKAAQTEERFLVTQDLDFSDARRFAPGTHHGLLVVRLPDGEHWRIADYLAAWFREPDAQTWEGCFVVATPTKVRVLRPDTRGLRSYSRER
jgi:predicted nuclease of predicted toxin-antitoxin system